MADRREIEAALNRRVQMDQTTPELQAFNEAAKDWYATCPKCGEALSGTMKQLKEHKCG